MTKPFPFTCIQCNKGFQTHAEYNVHKEIHEKAKLQCQLCLKEFSSAKTLKRHAIVHTGTSCSNNQLCNCLTLCCAKNRSWSRDGQTFLLVNLTCTLFPGEKNFECRVCHKRFARAGDLKAHSPIHHEEKPYKCAECFKTFSRYSSLKDHYRLHTGIKRTFLFGHRTKLVR